jgi:hypothetical protein
MDDPDKTVRVDTGQSSTRGQGSQGGDPQANSPRTEYSSPDTASPRTGTAADWGPRGTYAAPPPNPWGGQMQTPVQEGAATVLMPSSTLAEPSFAWLVMTAGTLYNQMIGQPQLIKKNQVTSIGRAPDNDIVIPDQACSARHARIRPEKDDAGTESFVIYDLGSSNHLYVGDKAHYRDDASQAYRHILHDGDYILIGETTLVFKQV